jgi:tetratricopeptide (TPR) repeat protein
MNMHKSASSLAWIPWSGTYNRDEATSCYNKSGLIFDKVLALYYKGVMLFKSGKYDESIQNYDKLIEIAPNDVALSF